VIRAGQTLRSASAMHPLRHATGRFVIDAGGASGVSIVVTSAPRGAIPVGSHVWTDPHFACDIPERGAFGGNWLRLLHCRLDLASIPKFFTHQGLRLRFLSAPDRMHDLPEPVPRVTMG